MATEEPAINARPEKQRLNMFKTAKCYSDYNLPRVLDFIIIMGSSLRDFD